MRSHSLWPEITTYGNTGQTRQTADIQPSARHRNRERTQTMISIPPRDLATPAPQDSANTAPSGTPPPAQPPPPPQTQANGHVQHTTCARLRRHRSSPPQTINQSKILTKPHRGKEKPNPAPPQTPKGSKSCFAKRRGFGGLEVPTLAAILDST